MFDARTTCLRWTPVGLLALCLCISAAATHADAPDPAPPDLQAILDAVYIRPHAIDMSMSVQLDDDLQPSRREHQMTMRVLLEYAPELAVRRCDGIDINHAITSAGELLKVQELEHMHHWRGFFPGGRLAHPGWFDDPVAARQPGQTVTLFVPFQHPSHPADRIDTLTGTVHLRVASGPVRHAVLAPFQAVHGRRVRIPNLDDGEVRIRTGEHGQLEIRMSSNLGDLFKQVTFYSGDNRELPANEFGSHVDGDRAVFYYDVQLPDDASIAMAFYSRADDFQVPFRWQNIPLPTPPAGADAWAVRLRDWLLSEDGQSLVQASGYVTLGRAKPIAQPDAEAEGPGVSKADEPAS